MGAISGLYVAVDPLEWADGNLLTAMRNQICHTGKLDSHPN